MDDIVINRADEHGRSIYLGDRPAASGSVIFTGAPGAGKSYVLGQAADQAEAAGDLVIRIDASSREPLESRMTRSIGDQLDQLKDRTPFGAGRLLRRLRQTLDTMLSNRFGIQNAVSGSLSWWPPLRLAFTHARDQQYERPTSSVNDLADRLGDLAADQDQRVLLVVDNLDHAQETDLAAINELATHLQRSDTPVTLAAAASPPALDKLLVASMPEGLAADAARCYDVRTCGPIADTDLRSALAGRITRTGTALLPDAADRLVTEANGDPGRLLRLADRATELASTPHGVTAEIADATIGRMRHDDAWIYNAGWNNLSGRAKAFLADAAAEPHGSNLAELNTGLDLDEWAERDAARNELIRAGLVRESDGRLTVADLGLREWVTQHTGTRPVLSPAAAATAPGKTTGTSKAGDRAEPSRNKPSRNKPSQSKPSRKKSSQNQSSQKKSGRATSAQASKTSGTTKKATRTRKSAATKRKTQSARPEELSAAQPAAARSMARRRTTQRQTTDRPGRA